MIKARPSVGSRPWNQGFPIWTAIEFSPVRHWMRSPARQTKTRDGDRRGFEPNSLVSTSVIKRTAAVVILADLVTCIASQRVLLLCSLLRTSDHTRRRSLMRYGLASRDVPRCRQGPHATNRSRPRLTDLDGRPNDLDNRPTDYAPHSRSSKCPPLSMCISGPPPTAGKSP